PPPRGERTVASSSYTAPRSELEQQLAQLWSQLLNVDRIGVHDDFFRLGGHSLLGIQLVARINDQCGVALALRDLFESPTLAALAQRIETLRCNGSSLQQQLPAVTRAKRNGPLPLSFGQEALWLIDQLEEGASAYMALTAVRLHGPLNVAALQAALERLCERHEILRTT